MSQVSWKRILATTDFSPFGNHGVSVAHDLAEQFGAELHVLHVADDTNEAARQHGATGIVEPDNLGNDYDDWLARLFGETGTIRRINAVQIGPDVAGKIAHYAEKHDIDLIVMASHGRTGFKHLLLGSVTEKVLRMVHCPVLVLRPAPAKSSHPAVSETAQADS